jgi:hypothetical protein
MHTVRTAALTGSDQVVSGSAGIYAGFAVRETAGAVAVVRVYDSASAASGTLLDTIALAANESAREFYPGGVWCSNGVYVKIVSGAVEGSVRIA